MKTFLNTKFHRGATEKGFSLIELLISISLGILLVGGVISLFLANQQNFAVNDNLAKLQESARFAYEQMNREIRDAGTNPCGVRAVNTVIGTAGATRTIPWWGDWDAGTVRGYDGDKEVSSSEVVFGASINNRVTGTDAIVVMRTANEDNRLRTVAAHDLSAKSITLNSKSNFNAKDLVFMCDNSSGALFEISAASGGTPEVLSYENSGSNCSDSLGWKTGVSCTTNSVTKSFTIGSVVTKFDPAIWYVGVASDGISRALYRETVHKDGTKITTERREFVPDIEDMQISYLLRTNPPIADTSTPPTLSTTWSTAAEIDALTDKWSPANRQEAVAVRIELTFKSKDKVGIEGNTSKALERKTVAVISLRNRELKR